jgi:hypothetical protein
MNTHISWVRRGNQPWITPVSEGETVYLFHRQKEPIRRQLTRNKRHLARYDPTKFTQNVGFRVHSLRMRKSIIQLLCPGSVKN